MFGGCAWCGCLLKFSLVKHNQCVFNTLHCCSSQHQQKPTCIGHTLASLMNSVYTSFYILSCCTYILVTALYKYLVPLYFYQLCSSSTQVVVQLSTSSTCLQHRALPHPYGINSLCHTALLVCVCVCACARTSTCMQ